MSATEKTDSTQPAADRKPATARTPARASSRLLSVVNGKEQRSLHLSPILQQIKDDGPAVIDGEVVPEAAAAARLAKPAASDTKPAAALLPPLMNSLLGDRQTKILFGFCMMLTIGLACSLWFSWQQQQHLETVEYLLETLVAGQR